MYPISNKQIISKQTTQNLFQISIDYVSLTYFLFSFSVFMFLVLITSILINKTPIFLKSIWLYGLFILQALTSLYFLSITKCFIEGGWCQQYQSNTSYKILLVFSNLILFFGICIKNNVYYPFHSVTNLLSMQQNNITLFLFFYRLAMNILRQPSDFSESLIDQTKILLTIGLYLKSSHAGYLHNFPKKLWNIFYLIVAWSQFSYLLIKRCKYHGIVGINGDKTMLQLYFQFWGSTIPLIVITAILSQKQYMHKNSYKLLFGERGHRIQKQQTRSRIYLMCNQTFEKVNHIKHSQLKYKNPQYKNLLKLISKHLQTCIIPTCQLKQLQNFMKQAKEDEQPVQNRFFKKVLFYTLQYCREILKSLHYDHPHDLSITIEMASYQMFALNYKQQGMILYNQKIEDQSVSNQNKYAITFLKKKIDDIFFSAKKLSQQNIPLIQAEFRQKLQFSATKLSNFWYFLSEPKCNLKKLYQLTNQLFPLKLSIQQQWSRIKQLNSIKCINLYAIYLAKLMNDKNKSLQILQQLKKIEHQQTKKNQIQIDETKGQIVEQEAIIFLQFGGKKTGIIFQNNINAEKLFGYSKGQILNQPVTNIMPIMISRYHDRILQNYQQTGKSSLLNKQLHLWGKTKSGYIFPFVILLKPVLSLYTQSSRVQVFASIRPQQYLKQSVLVFVDTNKQILDFSASALKIFPNLQYKSLNKKMQVHEIIPQFQQYLQKHKNNQPCQLKISRQIELDPEDNSSKIMEEITMIMGIIQMSIMVAGFIGYILKITKVSGSKYYKKMQQTKQIQHQSMIQNSRMQMICNFQFNIKVTNNDFRTIYQNPNQKRTNKVTKYPDNDQFQKIKQIKSIVFTGTSESSKQQGQSFLQESVLNFKQYIKHKQNLDVRNKVSWDDDIHVKRLTGGFIRQMREQSISDFQKKQSQNDISSQDRNAEQIKSNQLNQVIDKLPGNIHIRIIRVLTIIVILLCCLFAIMQYILETQLRNSALQNIKKFKTLNSMISEVMAIKFSTIYFSRYSHRDKIVADINDIEYGFSRDETGLQTWQKQFDKTIKQLDSHVSSFIFNGNTTVTYQDYSQSQYYSGFALNKLISEANTVKNKNSQSDSLLNKTQSNSFFVVYNTVNGILLGLKQQKLIQLQQQEQNLTNRYELRFIFLIVVISITVIVVIIKNLSYHKAMKKKAQILSIFFQLPRKTCSNLHKQCQRFIYKVTNQDDLEVDDVGQEQMQNQPLCKKKKRTIIGQQNSTKKFVMITIFFFMICIAFFVYQYIEAGIQRQNFNKINSAIKNCFSLESNFAILQNFMNSQIDYPSLPLNGNTNNLQAINSTKQQLQQNIRYIQTYYLKLYQVVGYQFLENLRKQLYDDFCQWNQDSCKKILTTQKHGFNSVQNSYFIHLKQKYQNIKTSSNPSLDLISKQQLTQQFMYMQALKMLTKSMTEALQSEIIQFFTDLNNKFLYILIAFCLIMLVVLMGSWLKYYSNLQDKIKATQHILTFIPANQINRNYLVASFIRKNYPMK